MKELTLFQHANYRGASLTLKSNRSQLPAGFNASVSSARVAHPVALFTGNRYTGDVALLTTDTSRFSAIRGRNLNDQIRSVRYMPLRIRLNITVGTNASGNTTKSMQEVSDHVTTANDLWSPFGIEFEPTEIRTVEGLRQPMTAQNQDALMAPYLRSNMVNILYFAGTHWQAYAWRWRIKSIDLARTPGSTTPVSVEVYDQPNYEGTKTTLTTDTSSLSDDQLPVRSMKLGAGTNATVYSAANMQGERLDVFNHVPTFDDLHFIRNWWGNKAGHCCHGPGSLIRNDEGSTGLVLAHELGHWMGLGHQDTSATNLMFPSVRSSARTITFAQAEQVWKSVLGSASARATLI